MNYHLDIQRENTVSKVSSNHFFTDRPDRFSELCQRTQKTRQNFEKTSQKIRF